MKLRLFAAAIAAVLAIGVTVVENYTASSANGVSKPANSVVETGD